MFKNMPKQNRKRLHNNAEQIIHKFFCSILMHLGFIFHNYELCNSFSTIDFINKSFEFSFKMQPLHFHHLTQYTAISIILKKILSNHHRNRLTGRNFPIICAHVVVVFDHISRNQQWEMTHSKKNTSTMSKYPINLAKKK